MAEDPQNLTTIGGVIGGIIVVAVGVMKAMRIRVFGPPTESALKDLHVALESRFEKMDGRFEKMDRKFEDTHQLLNGWLRECGERVKGVEVKLDDQGRRIGQLEDRIPPR